MFSIEDSNKGDRNPQITVLIHGQQAVAQLFTGQNQTLTLVENFLLLPAESS